MFRTRELNTQVLSAGAREQGTSKTPDITALKRIRIVSSYQHRTRITRRTKNRVNINSRYRNSVIVATESQRDRKPETQINSNRAGVGPVNQGCRRERIAARTSMDGVGMRTAVGHVDESWFVDGVPRIGVVRERDLPQKESTQSSRENRSEHVSVGSSLVNEAGLSTKCLGLECSRERSNVQKRSTQSLRENRSEHVGGWTWNEKRERKVHPVLNSVADSTLPHLFHPPQQLNVVLHPNSIHLRARCDSLATTGVDLSGR